MPSPCRTDDDLADLRAAAIADADAEPWSSEVAERVLATVRALRRARIVSQNRAV